MENQTVRNIQQNLANSPVRPIYADEIVVAQTVKTGKDEKGKVIKEGHVQLVFIDMTTQRPVDKVILSRLTAKGLYKALGDSIVKLEKELKSKKIEKNKKVETDYIR